MNNPRASARCVMLWFLTKDQSHAQGLNNPEQPVFGVLCDPEPPALRPPHPASPPKNQATPISSITSVKQTWTLLNVTVSSHVTSGMQKASRAALLMKCSHLICTDCFSTSLSLHVMPLLQTQPLAPWTRLNPCPKSKRAKADQNMKQCKLR